VIDPKRGINGVKNKKDWDLRGREIYAILEREVQKFLMQVDKKIHDNKLDGL